MTRGASAGATGAHAAASPGPAGMVSPRTTSQPLQALPPEPLRYALAIRQKETASRTRFRARSAAAARLACRRGPVHAAPVPPRPQRDPSTTTKLKTPPQQACSSTRASSVFALPCVSSPRSLSSSLSSVGFIFLTLRLSSFGRSAGSGGLRGVDRALGEARTVSGDFCSVGLLAPSSGRARDASAARSRRTRRRPRRTTSWPWTPRPPRAPSAAPRPRHPCSAWPRRPRAAPWPPSGAPCRF